MTFSGGIQSTSIPPLRGCVTALHSSLAVVAFIHDVEWHESNGTDESFRTTKDRFRRNGYKVAEAEFGCYNPRRWIVMNQARRFGNICQKIGKSGWLKCHRDRQGEEDNAE